MTKEERIAALHEHLTQAKREALAALDLACKEGSDRAIGKLRAAEERIRQLNLLTLTADYLAEDMSS
jgi:hypothetical protein